MQVDTQRNSVLPKGFYAKYSKIFKTKVESFNINTFQSIGFVDPFPKEERANRYRGGLPAEVDGQIAPVYPADRYVEEYSPYCLYIPPRDIMFKLMRACIMVERP